MTITAAMSETRMAYSKAEAPSSRRQGAFVLERRGSLEVSEGEGAVDAIGRIMGTNIHGCFDAADFRRNFLDTLRADRGWPQVGRTSSFNLEDEYDRLADLVEAHLDWPAILNIVEEGVTQLKGGRSG